MKCSVCGEKAGLMTAQRTKYGDWLCLECFKKAGGFKTWMQIRQMPLGALIEKVNKSSEATLSVVPQTNGYAQESDTQMIPTQIIGNNLMLIDEKNQKVQFPKISISDWLNNCFGAASGNTAIYNFSDIIGYEVFENNNSITKGGLGGALVGGLTFGETGAIVGSIISAKKTFGICRSLQVKVTVKNFDNPTIFVECLEGKASKNSRKYKNAVEDASRIVSAIQIIMSMDLNKT